MSFWQWIFGQEPTRERKADMQNRVFDVLVKHEIESIVACEIVKELEALKAEEGSSDCRA